MSYVDAFVLGLPADKVEAYRIMATDAGKVWMDHGALDYAEYIGDDLQHDFCLNYPQLSNIKDGEVPVVAFIRYESREHRDAVNAKVMADARMNPDVHPEMPFDVKRMAFGGFKALVRLGD